MKSEIVKNLNDGRNIILVGTPGGGKTWFLKRTLIPELRSRGFVVSYLQDADRKLAVDSDASFVVIDEFETLLDGGRLEENHPDEKPYYTDEYIEQVREWHKKISEIKQPLILVLTRDKEDIPYVKNEIQKTDWGAQVVVIEFDRARG